VRKQSALAVKLGTPLEYKYQWNVALPAAAWVPHCLTASSPPLTRLWPYTPLDEGRSIKSKLEKIAVVLFFRGNKASGLIPVCAGISPSSSLTRLEPVIRARA
jgi:hypothetical protein